MELEEIKIEATKLAQSGELDKAVAFMIDNWKMHETLMNLGILRVQEGDIFGVIEWINGFR